MTQKTIPANIKHGNFIRLAEARTTRALNAIRLIRNLSNSYTYEYSEDEVDAILTALQAEVDDLKRIFRDKTKRSNFRIAHSQISIAS